MFKKAALILLPLVILLTLLGGGHLAARTVTFSDTPLVRLQLATFDPLTGEPDIPDGQRLTVQADRPATYLVQFTGPVRDEWKAAVEKAGARLYGYIPDYAFIVRMNPATARRVQAIPFVHWVGPYHPAYRLAPTLRAEPHATQSAQPAIVTVQTLPDADLDALAGQIEAWGGEVQGQAANAFAGYLRVSLSAGRLTALATLDSVLWVEPYFAPELANDVGGGQIMRVDDVRSSLDLYGSGQIVGVADTGLDLGSTTDIHTDFAGRVNKIYALGRPGDGSDPNGHGTHVAGSAVGGGVHSGSNPGSHSYSSSFAGTAPEARLVFQSLQDAQGGLGGIPGDLNDLFTPAYNDGVRIHNNSWGGPTGGTHVNPEYGGYTIYSQMADQFLWNHRDMAILFATGNAGTDRVAPFGVVDPDSIMSPGTAKNVITVGASESLRVSGGYNPGGLCDSWGNCWPDDFGYDPIANDLPSNNANGMAAFSGRGPTDDGRVKPDVVAPGANIVSVRTRHAQAGTGWGVYDDHYLYLGGTSMASPLTAGATALVREWLTRIQGVTDPSGALMKALLLNGAVNMAPGQYGTGNTQEILPLRPNNVTGWGRVDLMGSLAPPPPRNIWGQDEATGLSTGSSVTYKLVVGPPLTTRQEATTRAVIASCSIAQLRYSLGKKPIFRSPRSLTEGGGARSETFAHRDLFLSSEAKQSPGRKEEMAPFPLPSSSQETLLAMTRAERLRQENGEARSQVERGTSPSPRLASSPSDLAHRAPAEVPPAANATGTDVLGADQLLLNPGFETGDWVPWQTYGSPTLNGAVSHSGSWSADLGGDNDVDDNIWQEVDIPADATDVTIGFWARLSTDEVTTEADHFCYDIWDQAITTAYVSNCADFGLIGNLDWTEEIYSLTPGELADVAGQTVLLAFYVVTDDSLPSQAWVDDTALYVTTPDVATPTPTATATPTATPPSDTPTPTTTPSLVTPTPTPTVPPSAGGPFRVILAWTDYPGQPAAAKALVNDLDLEVIAPDDTHYYGNQGLYSGGQCLWAGKWDACNNVEGIIIPNALDGTYTVIVHGANVPQGGSQPFALVALGDDLREEQYLVYLPLVLKNQ